MPRGKPDKNVSASGTRHALNLCTGVLAGRFPALLARSLTARENIIRMAVSFLRSESHPETSVRSTAITFDNYYQPFGTSPGVGIPRTSPFALIFRNGKYYLKLKYI